MAEMTVGLARHAGEVVLRNGVTHERADDLHRDLRVGPPGKASDRTSVELRPSRRNIEAAVRREPRQRGLDKAERWSLTPGGDIAHEPGLHSRLRRRCAGHHPPNGKTT